MNSTKAFAILAIFCAFFTSFTFLRDDSINYVRIAQVQVPNSVCNSGVWATMLNSHNTKRIRVYYNKIINGSPTPMHCDAHPRASIPDPKDLGTLLGCAWQVDYKITSAEYLP